MRQVRDLVGDEGAAAARVIGPAMHARLEEGAVDDQLPPSFEQVEQAGGAVGPLEPIVLVDPHPRHAPPLGHHRVVRFHLGLFLGDHRLPEVGPFVPGDDGRVVPGELSDVGRKVRWARHGSAVSASADRHAVRLRIALAEQSERRRRG
jgi:hypothetical protein